MKEEKTLIFIVDDRAKIVRGGEKISFDEIRKGMQVSIKYKKNGSRMIAERIRVLAKNTKEGRRNLLER